MFKIKHKICDPEPGTGGGSTGVTFTQEQVDELNAEIERLRNHTKTLLTEKKTLKTQFDDFKTQFEGFEPDNFKKMLSVFESSEEAKLIADGKLDEVIKKRTEKVLLTKESVIEDLNKKYSDLEKSFKDVIENYSIEKINNAVRSAAEKFNVLPTAIDDVVSRGLRIFSVGDDGNIEARDANGELVKQGGKALTTDLFVKGLQETAPHFWPQSKGAGATGGSAYNNGINPFKKGKNYNLTEQAKIRRSDPELAAKLKKEAEASE